MRRDRLWLCCRLGGILSLVVILLAGCGPVLDREGTGAPHFIHIAPGSPFAAVTDSLAAAGLVQQPTLFRLYARVKGADRRVKAGTYRFREGTGWDRILEDLRLGRIVTERLVIPEAWDLPRTARLIAAVTDAPPDSVLRALTDSALVGRLGVPGPTLEGYLYPATYEFPVGVSFDTVVARLVGNYQRIWTPVRRARADSLGLSEREVVTLASIVEKEARIRDEMPLIASVYHNRLERGIPLQADPTVQYALGTHRQRLLYAAIDSVARNPYNTYTHRGLPPGPIASPSARAVDAVLWPADSDYYYFVAEPQGSHIFTESLEEHNRAKQRVRAMQRESAERP